MNVTYLLGAGASANALPTYENFSRRFSRFNGFIYSMQNEIEAQSLQLTHTLSHIKDLIEKVKAEFTYHLTPDLIAKKYFHKNKTQLETLKQITILYFLYEQASKLQIYDEVNQVDLIKDITDKRYDALIASLLKPIPEKISILDNFSILTWNYDLQFELAFSTYVQEMIPKVQTTIQSFPKILDNSNAFDVNKFSLIHLNGIAYARPDKGKRPDNLGLFVPTDLNFALYLSDVYDAMITTPTQHKIGGTDLLSFAWENINEDYSLKKNDVLNNALMIAEKTEILVIIGYSFPIFNRMIDKRLFDKMKNLRRVYIQSPQANEINKILLNDLLPGNFDNIENIGYWNQFYIPYEWQPYTLNDLD